MSTTATATRRRNIRRRALLVGIDEYQNPANSLRGCKADIRDFAETMLILGFPPTRIKTITDEDATRQGILNGLDWLVKDADNGDVLIFYYSGHGSQVADLDGDEHDELDEIICPYDISFAGKGRYIVDDDLHDYFTSKVPTSVRTDVLLDCCHAQTGTRSLITAAEAPVSDPSQYLKARYMPPSLEHQFRINSSIPSRTKVHHFGDDDSTPTRKFQKQQNNVTWGASQEWQLAWELNLGGEIRGAFSYYFTRILRRADGNIPREDMYRIGRTSLANDGFSQVPSLEVPNAEALKLFPFRKRNEMDRLGVT